MTGLDDFGGLVGHWVDGLAYVSRVGLGEFQEGIELTPLNALQLRKLMDGIIETGIEQGHITPEIQAIAEQLPMSRGTDNIMPRDEVNKIAGDA